MKKFKSWKEYYTSKQDAYLDERNCASCDIQLKIGEADEYCLYGQTNIEAYSFETEDGKLIAIYTDASLEKVLQDVKAYIEIEG